MKTNKMRTSKTLHNVRNYHTPSTLVGKIAKITEITELNIGHFTIGEAVFVGLKKSILKMRKIIDNSRKKNFYLKSA